MFCDFIVFAQREIDAISNAALRVEDMLCSCASALLPLRAI